MILPAIGGRNIITSTDFFLIHEHVEQIKRANRNKVFQHGIDTDGLSMGLLFDKGPITFNETVRIGLWKWPLSYQCIVSLDPGCKLYLAGVIRNVAKCSEHLIELSSKLYYTLIKQFNRDRLFTQIRVSNETQVEFKLAAREHLNSFESRLSSNMRN